MHAGAASAQALVQAVPLWPSVTRTVALVKRKNRTLPVQAARIWTHVVSSYDEEHKPLQTAHACPEIHGIFEARLLEKESRFFLALSRQLSNTESNMLYIRKDSASRRQRQ